jgi:BlaI family transcriptional regulator, penicillinase repressor
MARPKADRPTDAELTILNVMWETTARNRTAGLTIRQIQSELKKAKPSTYATTQTLVRIMEKKGLLRRGPERYPALYYPASAESIAKGRLVRDFMDRVFGGSVKQLVLHALSSKATKRDMEQIEKIIDEMKD